MKESATTGNIDAKTSNIADFEKLVHKLQIKYLFIIYTNLYCGQNMNTASKSFNF